MVIYYQGEAWRQEKYLIIFTASEFECECGCGFDTVDAELITVLEDVHGYFSEVYDAKVRDFYQKRVPGALNTMRRCKKRTIPTMFRIRLNPSTWRPKRQTSKSNIISHTMVGFDVPADSVAGYLENKYPDRYGIGRYIGRDPCRCPGGKGAVGLPMNDNYQYTDLTDKQKKKVNGCGSSFWLAVLFRLPRCLFPLISRACDCHDIGYQETGLNLAEKWALDAQLVEDIREVARRSSNPFVRWWKFRISDLVEWALDTKLSEMCWRAAKR